MGCAVGAFWHNHEKCVSHEDHAHARPCVSHEDHAHASCTCKCVSHEDHAHASCTCKCVSHDDHAHASCTCKCVSHDDHAHAIKALRAMRIMHMQSRPCVQMCHFLQISAHTYISYTGCKTHWCWCTCRSRCRRTCGRTRRCLGRSLATKRYQCQH